jgi:Zn-dependent protease
MQGLDLALLARKLAFVLIPMILSLSVHECAHAGAALALGDRTAKDAGRLTLNPQAHIDPWGTLFIPAMSVFIGGAPFIGWARPTPFRAMNFREGINRRLGSALVAAAGPLSNVALALLSLSVLAVLGRMGVSLYTMVQDGDAMAARPSSVYAFLLTMYELNLGLAFFNLLPIPPLDGYRLLPPALDRYVRPLERYGFALIMIAFLLLPPGILGTVFRPLYFVMDRVQMIFGVA